MNDTQLRPVLGNRPFRFFHTTGSTMQDAHNWLTEQPDLPTGAVIIADEQTQGKGRMGRHWLTPPESAIAMTVIIREPAAVPVLTMLVGVAVADVLTRYSEKVSLKWANDVLLDGKKVCGILAESIWEGDQFKAAMVGIGLNLTVDFAGTELAELATSLTHHTAQPIYRPELISAILGRINHWLAYPDQVLPVWKSRLSTLGQTVTVSANGDTFYGVAVDIDAEGALILERADGGRQTFLVGDVSVKVQK